MSRIKNLLDIFYKIKSFDSDNYHKSNLLILDDIFPNSLSDWRLNEFVHYLKVFENTHIYTGILNNNNIIVPNDFDYHFEKFKTAYSKFESCVYKLTYNTNFKSNLGYCLFYNNLRYAYPIFEKNKIPFVFTLYPGGGFSLYNKDFDNALIKYLNSAYFRHVIVNMPNVYEYILDRYKISKDKISYIYGAPLNLPVNERCDEINSEKIRVVFSSHKYTQYGIDKGFDIFNLVAKRLEGDTRFSFTVIGGFSDHDLVEPTTNIEFKSHISSDALLIEFQKYDIIMSPNRSHISHIGAFDGFPTGTIMHAVNSGCLMMISDEMGNAPYLNLINNVDYVLISTNVESIVDSLIKLANSKHNIYKIARNGKLKIMQNLDLKNQMKKRIEIMENYL
jgi:hypothetical protein